MAICVVAYAFSPIDLIPDFIPVLGYLDDLILVPLGISLALKLIPPHVIEANREKAEDMKKNGKPKELVCWHSLYFNLGVICSLDWKIIFFNALFMSTL
ncbi:DUF1232 domain-containing protein [Peribacillus frigoritolerans]|nr:DUF1232 domain-containing protein [Peribacillus frigoritolerans]